MTLSGRAAGPILTTSPLGRPGVVDPSAHHPLQGTHVLVPHDPDLEPDAVRPAALDRPAWIDTDVLDRLDRVTRSATRLFDAPLGMVSLGDDVRQRPVSTIAAEAPSVAAELTWLAGVVATAGPLEVADLDLDPRFAARSTVAGGQRIRAYAGIPLHGGDGQVVGTLGVADVRPRVSLPTPPVPLADLAGWVEAELARADDLSSALERMKDEFLATVSHELRTPLTSVKGALSLALAGVMGEMDDDVRTLLEVGLENTDRLVRLVSDILDLERLLGGQLPFSPTDTDARALVAAAIDSVRTAADAAGVIVDVAVEPAALFVDVDRTVQVLGHLVRNAILHSPPQGVVTVATTTSTEGVVFVVADQGPGVPPEARTRIFERFAHADTTDRREQPGSGLGLPLARGLAEQQGGWLDVASAPGGGASFRLTLPPAIRSKVDL